MNVAFATSTFETLIGYASDMLVYVLPLALGFAVGLGCVYLGYRLFKRFTGVHK